MCTCMSVCICMYICMSVSVYVGPEQGPLGTLTKTVFFYCISSVVVTTEGKDICYACSWYAKPEIGLVGRSVDYCSEGQWH